MHKPRFHWHLDQALFVVVIMAGAVVSAVLDVQAISAAIASGRYGLGASVALAAPVPLMPPGPAASGAGREHAKATVVARLAN